jgi:hypothetical protein
MAETAHPVFPKMQKTVGQVVMMYIGALAALSSLRLGSTAWRLPVSTRRVVHHCAFVAEGGGGDRTGQPHTDDGKIEKWEGEIWQRRADEMFEAHLQRSDRHPRQHMCMKLRGAGDSVHLSSLRDNSSAPAAPGPAASRSLYMQESLASLLPAHSVSEGTLHSKGGQSVGARSRAPKTTVVDEQNAVSAGANREVLQRSVEDIVLPNGRMTPGDRAVRFGRAAMDGQGGLRVMQHALALARKQELDFDAACEILVNLTALAAQGKGALVCPDTTISVYYYTTVCPHTIICLHTTIYQRPHTAVCVIKLQYI